MVIHQRAPHDRARPPVPRARLLAVLDGDEPWRVALVRARAGSGKTTALRDWAGQLDVPAVVVELGATGSQEVLERLVRTKPGPRVVLVDSIERATEAWTLEALDALVRAADETSRVVLSGRSTPHLRELAVLRVHDDLVDLGDGELELDEQEAQQLYELSSGCADADASRAVLERTDGWAAGFCLIAKERRSHPARSVGECVDLAMPAVRDYLFDDVFDRIEPQLREMALDVSVLDPLSAAMCDAVRSRTDSARLLRDLERESLFLARVRSEPGRLRINPLVRSVLEDELAMTDPDRHRALHNRAARWCRGQGDEVGAMRHLVAGGDLDGAWKRFRDHWAERYFAGDFSTVRGWCELLGGHAQLDVERASELALALLLLGRVNEAEHYVNEASLAWDAADEPRNVCLELARFFHATCRGAVDVALEHAGRARGAADADPPPIWRRVRASLVLAAVLAFSGRDDEAEVELRRAFADEDPASPVDGVLFPAARARLALLSGHLLEAEEHASRSIDATTLLGGASRGLIGEALASMGYVQLERNELPAAERTLLRAIDSADAIGYAPVRVVGRLSLARIHHARGQRDAALSTVAECRRLAGTRLDRHFNDRIAEAEAQLRLCEGDPAGALQLLPPDHGERLRLTEARAKAALGDHDAALTIVSTVDMGNPYRALRVHLVRARCASDAPTRQAELIEAIRLAEASGFTRLLLDERSWLLEHLRALAPTWPTDFVAGLVERSVQELAIRNPEDRLARLSERELEVWRQLSTPLSLSEIARRLFISRNTMKTHVRNIYRKLEVATREAAVAVANADPVAERRDRRSG